MARVTPRPSAERVKHVENVDNKVLNAVSSDCALGDLGGVVSNASNDYAAAAHVLAGEQKQEVAQLDARIAIPPQQKKTKAKDSSCCHRHKTIFYITLYMVKYTGLWLCTFLVLCLVLSGVAAYYVLKDIVLGLENPIGGRYDIYLPNDKMTKSFDMLTDAMKRVDTFSGSRERESIDLKRRLHLIYKWKNKQKVRNDVDIFTATNVQGMCEVEHVFLAQDGAGTSYEYDFCVLDYGEDEGRATPGATPRATPGATSGTTPGTPRATPGATPRVTTGTTRATPTGKPLGCKAQTDTPAGTIYTALTGQYPKSCPLLREEDVQQAALCLLYFPYIDDEAASADAMEACTCFHYRLHHRHERCDSACARTATCAFDVSKGCGSDPRTGEPRPCNSPQMVARNNKRKAQFRAGRYMSKGVSKDPAKPSSGITSAYLYTGKPLYRDNKKLDDESRDKAQIDATNREFFSAVENELKELFAVSDPHMETNSVGDLVVLYRQLDLVSNEQSKVFAYDMLNLVGSATLVAIYLRVHIGSWFLALIGVVQISLSLPVSMFVFAIVMQIHYFKALQFLVLFIAMGIGADDIFVILNAWEQSESVREDAKSKFISHEHARIFFAVDHALDTIFSTSLTTSLAFFATAYSELLVLQTFGIFAGVETLMLFVFSILLMPVAILIWHRKWEFSNCCCCCAEKPCCRHWFWFAKSKRPRDKQAETTRRVESREEESGRQWRCFCVTTERFCRESTTMICKCVFAVLSNRRGPEPKSRSKLRKKKKGKGQCGFPAVALFIVVMTLSMTAFSTWQFALLEPPPEDEQYLPRYHMEAKTKSDAKNLFFGGHSDDYIQIQFVWGLRRLKRDKYDKWHPNANRGVAVWSQPFSRLTAFGDPSESSPALHDALANACRVIDDKKCQRCDKCGENNDLALLEDVYDADEPQHCWPHFFEQWVRGGCGCGDERSVNATTTHGPRHPPASEPACFCPSRFPLSNQTEYGVLLQRYRASNPKLWPSIGFVNNKLRFAIISFTSTAKVAQFGVADRRKLWECLQDTLEEINAQTKRIFANVGANTSAMQDTFVIDTDLNFMFMLSAEHYVEGFAKSIAVTAPICFFIMLLVTKNILIAFYVSLTVFSILMWVLGFFKWALDYKLGIVQSVSGVIVIGFSVDYCIHIAHQYQRARSPDEQERVRIALQKMGKTVLGGCITTFGAGAFLVPCVSTFFNTMAYILLVTITVSLYHSVFFLPSVFILLGRHDHRCKSYCWNPHSSVHERYGL